MFSMRPSPSSYWFASNFNALIRFAERPLRYCMRSEDLGLINTLSCFAPPRACLVPSSHAFLHKSRITNYRTVKSSSKFVAPIASTGHQQAKGRGNPIFARTAAERHCSLSERPLSLHVRVPHDDDRQRGLRWSYSQVLVRIRDVPQLHQEFAAVRIRVPRLAREHGGFVHALGPRNQGVSV